MTGVQTCALPISLPPPRTNISTLHKHYTNWNSNLIFTILVQSSGKRRHGCENVIWKSVHCLVARMVGSWVWRCIDGAMTAGKRSILAAIFCTTWSIIIWNNAPALFTGIAGAAWSYCIIWNIGIIRQEFCELLTLSIITLVSFSEAIFIWRSLSLDCCVNPFDNPLQLFFAISYR